MTPARTGLLIPRRTAMLGAVAAAPLISTLCMPFIARAADSIRIGLLLAKTGQIAAQTEYLANGTFLALTGRDNKINRSMRRSPLTGWQWAKAARRSMMSIRCSQN